MQKLFYAFLCISMLSCNTSYATEWDQDEAPRENPINAPGNEKPERRRSKRMSMRRGDVARPIIIQPKVQNETPEYPHQEIE